MRFELYYLKFKDEASAYHDRKRTLNLKHFKWWSTIKMISFIVTSFLVFLLNIRFIFSLLTFAGIHYTILTVSII